MGTILKRALIIITISLLGSICPLTANAKLVHSLNDMVSQKLIREFVFKRNNRKFSFQESITWLKKNYPTQADHQYINKHFKQVKFGFKPVLFYYPEYIELRVFGKSYGKISDIDFINNTLKLNKQSIFFKKNQSLASIHQQILSAMEGHVSWSPMNLFIPKAEAFFAIARAIGLFVMIEQMRGMQSSTHGGNVTQTAEQICSNPGRTSRNRNLSQADRNMIDYAFHGNSDCTPAAYKFLESNPPMSAERIQRATALCNRSKEIKRRCKARESTPSESSTNTSTGINM